MVENDLLGRIFTLPAAAWTATLAFIAYLIRNRNERLRDISAEKAGDWKRLRDERDYWHAKALECQKEASDNFAEKIEYMHRAIAAEAHLEGRGRARQEAATIVAIERLTDRNKQGNGGGK